MKQDLPGTLLHEKTCQVHLSMLNGQDDLVHLAGRS
jgi:hypothetical protein